MTANFPSTRLCGGGSFFRFALHYDCYCGFPPYQKSGNRMAGSATYPVGVYLCSPFRGFSAAEASVVFGQAVRNNRQYAERGVSPAADSIIRIEDGRISE